MACLKLGTKSEAFHLEGQTWLCSTGLHSDVTIEVGEMSFQLHKFPLLSRSGLLEKLIEQLSSQDSSGLGCVLQLHDLPGEAKAFELITKFCYGVKIELSALNIVSVRCAAEYLQMTEDYGEGNLIAQSETFLNEVFANWTDTIKALETCEEVQQYAEDLHVVSRCIDSLAMKACADPQLFNWPVKEQNNNTDNMVWNGIITSGNKSQPSGDDWWYEDVSFLRLPIYKRLVLAVEAKDMKPENIAASLIYYTKRHLPLMNGNSSLTDANHVNTGTTVSPISEADQRALLEEIGGLIPNKKGVTTTNFLLRLLKTAMILHASPSCREMLEKRVGIQLDQAVLIDLLIPNMGYTVETLYDIDCVQRILDHFISVYQSTITTSPCIIEDGQMMTGTDTLTPMTTVANLVDGYLAEVAPDVNLKLPKFQALAAVIPDYARPLDDGIYHAIDVYLKAHPWLSDSEREQLCRLMNCQKLSIEASTHAAQNERLPLRVIVQVLFFEQLRLRTSISGWFFVSENLETSQSGNLALMKNDGSRPLGRGQEIGEADDVRVRVSELEKECSSMKMELEKLVKPKRSWSLLPKRLGFRRKSQPWAAPPKPSDDLKATASPVTVSEKQNHENANGNVLH